ncbi:hypothetical protein AAMO2058_000397100 [Amorphochlora amoebiformis]
MGQGNDRGSQYRSAIYYYNQKQLAIIKAYLNAYQKALTRKGFGKIQTEVQKAGRFYYAELHHQQYDAKPKTRRYCGLRPTGVPMPRTVSVPENEGDKKKELTVEHSLEEKRVKEEWSSNNRKSDLSATGAAKRLFMCAKLNSPKGSLVKVSEALNGKVIAYYHSAHWCGPCRQFTPKLAKIYEGLSKETLSRFEIVWRSYDTEKEEYDKYRKTMPWLALPYGLQSKGAKNRNKYIPSLIVYDADGKGITLNGVEDISTEAIIEWCKVKDEKEGDINEGKTISGKFPLIGPETIMTPKANGTTETPPMRKLRYNVDWKKANKICCYNRRFAEPSGYFQLTDWFQTVDKYKATVYYDSVTGKPLFRAPIGRTFGQFLLESQKHGWPSFRDQEVIWKNVRCLKNGECVSTSGTHLGHNLPDSEGNRYCVNLVSIAGNTNPTDTTMETDISKISARLVSLSDYIIKGYVDYKGLATTKGKKALSECVKYVETMDVTTLESIEVLCFYLNAYNIIIIKGVMEVLERNPGYAGHTSVLKRYNFYVKNEHIVAGKKISLFDLKNDLIRKMGEPRCHIYLNCGSMGCPKISPTWLTPSNIGKEFNRLSESFCSEQGGVIITKKGSRVSKASHSSSLTAIGNKKTKITPVMGEEKLMVRKAHGTCSKPPQQNLRWGCDFGTADRICCFNRHFAEYGNYWLETGFFADANRANGQMRKITFYDSVYGYPLFKAPQGRSWVHFLEESRSHRWLSFRDEEVIWDHVRMLPDGEIVSTGGTHLGHNLPDGEGNRYCINLVSAAGMPDAKGIPTPKEDPEDATEEKKNKFELRGLILNEFYPKGVKTRRYLLRKYPDCFVGKELVDFLIERKELMVEEENQTRMLSRHDCKALCQDLLNMGFFSHVLGEHQFQDKYLFYRFAKDGGAQIPGGKAKGPLLLLSNIFKWYQADFNDMYGGIFGFIREFHLELKSDKAMEDITDRDATFRYQMYDWRLNSVENAKKIKPLNFGTSLSSTPETTKTEVNEYSTT